MNIHFENINVTTCQLSIMDISVFYHISALPIVKPL